MSFPNRVGRAVRVLLLVTCGAVLPGGSCMSDIRANMVKGSLGFVSSFTQSLVNSLVPNVNELFPSVPAE